jgi:hypothetical protein
MIHKGKNSRSRIISKGISAGKSRNCYRGLVQMNAGAENAYNSSQCDSLLIGDNAAANTYPTIQVTCSAFLFFFGMKYFFSWLAWKVQVHCGKYGKLVMLHAFVSRQLCVSR